MPSGICCEVNWRKCLKRGGPSTLCSSLLWFLCHFHPHVFQQVLRGFSFLQTSPFSYEDRYVKTFLTPFSICRLFTLPSVISHDLKTFFFLFEFLRPNAAHHFQVPNPKQTNYVRLSALVLDLSENFNVEYYACSENLTKVFSFL